MTRDERMKKAIILNLINFERTWFHKLFDADVVDIFPELIDLEDLGYVTISENNISLTKNGLKYRDLIVQLFFSKQTEKRICDYSYRD